MNVWDNNKGFIPHQFSLLSEEKIEQIKLNFLILLPDNEFFGFCYKKELKRTKEEDLNHLPFCCCCCRGEAIHLYVVVYNTK